jgi:hypothetical protein
VYSLQYIIKKEQVLGEDEVDKMCIRHGSVDKWIHALGQEM